MGDQKLNASPKDLIIVCVDTSEHSLRAFNYYCEHFYRADHEIGLVHVHTPPEIPSFGKHYGDKNEVLKNEEYQRRLSAVSKKSTDIMQKYLNMCVERRMKVRVFPVEKVDSVGFTVCRTARENNATAVVIGQRGLGAVKRTILGSVSDYVLHHAHVTVIVVPPPKERSK